MLDPRIYRAALIPVVIAVILLAFSLRAQPGPVNATLAPDAFNRQNAASILANLARDYPDRRAGSVGDQALGAAVAQRFQQQRYQVSSDSFTGQTAAGRRTLVNVIATQVGFSSRRIVVVAPRDSLGASASAPAAAELSGTATLLELARVLSERRLNRTVVLASVSGGAGGAGFARLTESLGGSVDAVVVLGDLAGTRTTEPVVVPWSSGPAIAPPELRNTVAAALLTDAGTRPGASTPAAQLARLAFPLTLSGQGSFNGAGYPAVLISASGERGPAASAPVSDTRIGALGRAVLRAVTALEQGPAMPGPSAYVVYDRKLLPIWSVRLLALVLILPVVVVAVDGLARARRRRCLVGAWIGWALAAAAPFVLVAVLLALAGIAGALPAPPGAIVAGNVHAGAGAIVTLLAVAAAFVAALVWMRPALGRLAGAHGDPAEGGGSVAVLLVMCVTVFAIWTVNPFAALLTIPALHLWLWVLEPELRLRPPVSAALLLAGLLPPAIVAVYYASAFGLSIPGLVWTGVLLVAGGGLGVVVTLLWCLMLGCLASTAVIAVRLVPRRRPENLSVTVRGPVTYAGPGSLGGTDSALRRVGQR